MTQNLTWILAVASFAINPTNRDFFHKHIVTPTVHVSQHVARTVAAPFHRKHSQAKKKP